MSSATGAVTATNSVESGSAGGTAVPALSACTIGSLPTVTPGVLTVGTASGALSPWYLDADPASGKGFESALTYALAEGLGYGRDQVSWTVVDRAQAAAGVAGGFDIALGQFTASDIGTSTADYSTGYFSVTDALVLPAGATTPTVAAVRGMKLGAISGSTGVAAVQQGTGVEPVAFAGQDEAIAAVTAGAVAGLVLPIPAALAAARANSALVVAGQLPSDPSSQPEQLKVLLPKGSELTGCVSAVIDRLRAEGTLDQLAVDWVDPVVPELR